MKTHRIRIQTVAVLWATFGAYPLWGAERPAEAARSAPAPAANAVSPADQRSAALSTSPMAGLPDAIYRAERSLQTVSDLRGQPLQGAGQRELGVVEDFMVDATTGKVVYAVVKPRQGEGFRLVQQSSLRMSAGGLAADLDQELFQALETVTAAQLEQTQAAPVSAESQQLSAAVETVATSATPATTPAIGVLPPASDTVPAATTAAAAHPAPVTPATTEPVEVTAAPRTGPGLASPQQETQLVRASQLKGRELRQQGKTLGRIEALGLQWEEGKALALVQLGDNAGAADKRYYVPLSRLDIGQSEARTDLTPGDFERAQPLPMQSRAGQARAASEAEPAVTPTGRMPDEQTRPRANPAPTGQSGTSR